jgi:hypothetical protein
MKSFKSNPSFFYVAAFGFISCEVYDDYGPVVEQEYQAHSLLIVLKFSKCNRYNACRGTANEVEA